MATLVYFMQLYQNTEIGQFTITELYLAHGSGGQEVQDPGTATGEDLLTSQFPQWHAERQEEMEFGFIRNPFPYGMNPFPQ